MLLTDYSSAHLITIDDGQAKIQNGTFNFIHIINLNTYEKILRDTEEYVNINIDRNNIYYPLLKHEISQSTDILFQIKPSPSENRGRRSIDILGTAWKYLAGTPDHDDLKFIEGNLDELNRNNNQQITVNTELTKRINELTKITDQLMNSIKKDSYIDNEVALNIQNRIRLIKEELMNIKYAIEWAKANIINSILFNKKEIRQVLEKLSNENMPFRSVEDALEFTEIKILYNKTNILYLIKIPMTTKTIYQKTIIRPIKKNKKIVNIPFKSLLVNGYEIFGVQNDCTNYNSINICKQNQLTNLTNDKCVSRLIHGLESFCNVTNNHHIPTIEEISAGIILLNNFNGSCFYKNTSHNLNGTFLIKFHNETVNVNNKIFSNIDIPQMNINPPIIQPTPIEISRHNVLSLEALEELHIKNTNKINKIQSHIVISKISSFVSIGSIALLIIVIIVFKKQRKNVEFVIQQPELASPNPVIHISPTTTADFPIFPKLNNLPYF